MCVTVTGMYVEVKGHVLGVSWLLPLCLKRAQAVRLGSEQVPFISWFISLTLLHIEYLKHIFAIFNYYECVLLFVTEPVLWDENVKLENMKQYMLNHQAYWELARRIQVYITVWPSNQCATVGIDFIFLNPGSLICDNGQEQLALSEIHKLILCWEDCWLRMSLNGLAVKSL